MGRDGSISMKAAKQARNWSFEAEGRRKKEKGRRKEPEEVFLPIGDAPEERKREWGVAFPN
ncbi:hypothetical protein HC766_07750 [Candidatus Gracilibacteria bacterium]|nr:hypothetical protein [Candidatus Gracilibacteria bacterium]